MREYLAKLSLFTGIVIVLYLIFFYAIDRGLKKSQYLNYDEWNEIYDGNINADVIILGSSRAYKMVSPKIIDSVCNVNSYNLGLDGYHFPFQFTKLKIYLEHNQKPKVIIQIVDHFTIQQRENLFNVTQFLPYMSDTLLTNQMKQYEGLKWDDYMLPYKQYSGRPTIIAAGLAEFLNLKQFSSPKYKGYFPKRNGDWETRFDTELQTSKKNKTIKMSDKTINQFEDFIELCISENIQLFIVYAPEYKDFQKYLNNRGMVTNFYKNYSQKAKSTMYFDFKDHYLTRDKIYFYNPTHLNKKGSELFTKALADSIKLHLK